MLTALALAVFGFIRGLWVHSGSPWESFGSSVVVSITRVRPGGRWIHTWTLGSLVFAMGVAMLSPIRAFGYSCVAGFAPVRPGVVVLTRVLPGGRWVYSGSLGSLGFALRVGGFV